MYSGGFSYFFPHTLKFFASFSPPPTVVLILFALATQRDELSKWAMEGGCWVELQGVAIGWLAGGRLLRQQESVREKKTPPPFQDERLREGKVETLAERQQNSPTMRETAGAKERALTHTDGTDGAHQHTSTPHRYSHTRKHSKGHPYAHTLPLRMSN